MKLFQKIKDAYYNLIVRLFKKVPVNYYFVKARDFIIEVYKKIAVSNLQIETREVHVKKGKRKYTLLIFKDGNNKTVFNIGRYSDFKPVLRKSA